jgi:hypothetical protein
MADNFASYDRMRAHGLDPVQVYRQAEQDGLDKATRIRMIRCVFAMDFVSAKDVMVKAAGYKGIDDYQEQLAAGVDASLTNLEPGTTPPKR